MHLDYVLNVSWEVILENTLLSCFKMFVTEIGCLVYCLATWFEWLTLAFCKP